MSEAIDPELLKNSISNYLKIHGFTQRQAASNLDVSQSIILAMLDGKLKSIDILIKVAKVKGLLPEQFMAYLLGRTLSLDSPLTKEKALDWILSLSPGEQLEIVKVVAESLEGRFSDHSTDRAKSS